MQAERDQDMDDLEGSNNKVKVISNVIPNDESSNASSLTNVINNTGNQGNYVASTDSVKSTL